MIGVIAVMVLVSDLLREKEIIFPEIAALSMGCFLSPKLCWKTNYARMIVCIEVCAILGVCIVTFTELTLWLQVSLAFAVGQLVYMFSKTSLAPMISAIVLPVLLQTEGFVYPIAALLLTSLTAAVRIILEKTSVNEKNEYEHVELPRKADWLTFLFRTCTVAALTYFFISINAKFCVAPPLLVAFTELCKKDCPAAKRRPQLILLVSLCALAGAVIRLVFVMHLGLAPWVAAIIIGVLTVLLVQAFKLYFPPAGAMAVLALIIPDEAVLIYPPEVFLGITVLTVAAYVWVMPQAYAAGHKAKLPN